MRWRFSSAARGPCATPLGGCPGAWAWAWGCGGDGCGGSAVKARRTVASAVSAAGMDADADVPADVVARLAAGSRVAEGQEAELWMDAARLHLFDPVDGVRVGP